MLAFGGKLIEDPELKREIAERDAREAKLRLESLRRKELELLRSLEWTRQEVRETISTRPVADRSDLRGMASSLLSSPPKAPKTKSSNAFRERRSSPSHSKSGEKIISSYDLLPVLTTTGENALEVGLEKGDHVLPVFRMPDVSRESAFVRHLPTKREIRRLRRIAERRQAVEAQVQNTLRSVERLERKRTRQQQEESQPAGLLTSPTGQGAKLNA